MSIAPKTFQNDTFFTLAVGQKILQEGIYTEETFTWHEGLEYQNVRWLFDITIANIYNIGGYTGIYIFVMIMASIIGITLFYIFSKKSHNKLLAFLLTIATVFLGRTMFCARSQIVSFWLFILEAFFIERLLETGKKRYSIFLFINAVLIANVHAPLYPMFFVLFLPYIAEYILVKLKLKSNEDSKIIIQKRENIDKLLLAMFASVFAGLITPLGLIPYTDMFKTAGSLANELVKEMQPITIVNQTGFMCMIVVAIGIISFTKTKIKLVDSLFLLGFLLMSLSNFRSLYFFIFIGMLSIGKLVNDFLLDYKVDSWKVSAKYKSVLLILISIVLLAISAYNFVQKSDDEFADPGFFPIGATKYILKNIDTENMRLYNGFNFGSYLEFFGIPVFLDSRAEIYLEEFNDTTILKDYSEVSSGAVHYNEVFEEYEITHALLQNVEMLNIYIKDNENWKIIYQDDVFSLYERVNK